MKRRPVLHLPDPDLRRVAETISPFKRSELEPLFEEMVATMRQLRGIGLAATQIGLHQRVAVIELKDGPIILINPVMKKLSRKQEIDEEGCLSVPGIFGLVPRSFSLTLVAYDMDGKKFTSDAHGLFARVIQHEVDHLNGKVFVDRCTKLTAGHDRAQSLGITIPA
ncbi:MAG: peptide deformylase [Candidatus Kerfeldbacteria bacterium]|nr:peptide deformylase [Candidatus Kerfeldbacteria bacterium]